MKQKRNISQNPVTFNSRSKKPGNKGQELNKINLKTDSLGQPIISDVPSESIAEWPDKNGFLGRVLHSGHKSPKIKLKYIYISPTRNSHLFLKIKHSVQEYINYHY